MSNPESKFGGLPEGRDCKPPGPSPAGDQPTEAGPAGAATNPPTTDRSATATALASRYDILAELGRGGMGVVYKARDRETGSLVALKVLRPEIAGQSDVLERFKTELVLARKITHKNVCRVYDLNRVGDSAVISMELIEGESLRRLLQRVDGLSTHQGLGILRQVIAGLREAHAQGVVHRDLKPENVVIATDGTVKVMDFGIARSLESGATLTGMVLGTPAYMSPEQAEGKPADARSDIYSFGLVMYEVFTGCAAFRAETPVAVAMKQVREKPKPAREFEPDLPARLEDAIEKCLEKDPKKRFRNMDQLEASLIEERAGAAAPEQEPVPAAHLLVWGRRDWALIGLGVASLLYFLAYRGAVFPTARMRLEVDAIIAEREARSLANRLGRPFPSFSEAQLEYDADQATKALLRAVWEWEVFVHAGPHPSFRALSGVEIPLFWKVTFLSNEDRLLLFQGKVPGRYAVVNRKGKVEEYANPFTWLFAPRDYQPAPVERRREIAKEAVEQLCGALPAKLSFARLNLIETSGGESGASYIATWKPSYPADSGPWAEAALWMEKVSRVKCYPPIETMAASANVILQQGPSGFLRNIFRLGLLAFAIQLLVLFGMAQCHRSPFLWRRLPVACALGLTGVWVLGRNFAGGGLSAPMWIGGGIAASGLFLVGTVAIEHRLRRLAPASVASYLFALRGRFFEPAVGLAVVRGAFGGIVLAGAETLWLHLWSLASQRKFSWVMLSVYMDPTSACQALQSFSPALFVVCSAIFHGLFLGLLAAGVWTGSFKDTEKLRSRSLFLGQSFLLLGVGSGTAVAVVALRLHFGQVVAPGMGFMLAPIILGVVLGWLLTAYDVLTVIVAAGTSVLWTLNYPLLDMLQVVGNGAHWGIFIGWGVLVVAAALAASRAELARAWQRKRAEFA